MLQPQSGPPDITDLLRVLPDHRAPLIAFSRASRAQPRWGDDGELGLDNSGACFVPTSIIDRFKDTDEHWHDPEHWLSNETKGLLRLENVGTTIYISTGDSAAISSEERQDSDLLLQRRFDFLSIILRAQPDPYSSIEWEEVSSQLRETIELSCLSLLRVISFDDVRKYVASSQQIQTKLAPPTSK